MQDTVKVSETNFTWICPNCEKKNYSNPSVLDIPFQEVQCVNCGFVFGVQEPSHDYLFGG